MSYIRSWGAVTLKHTHTATHCFKSPSPNQLIRILFILPSDLPRRTTQVIIKLCHCNTDVIWLSWHREESGRFHFHLHHMAAGWNRQVRLVGDVVTTLITGPKVCSLHDRRTGTLFGRHTSCILNLNPHRTVWVSAELASALMQCD